MIFPYAKPSEARGVVLFVEDEILIRMATADHMRLAGYQVIEASNADEALEYLRMPNEIGLVFSDVRMPGSMDGLELAQRIRRLYPFLPVLLTSGQFLTGERDGVHFLSKPYKLAEVASKVRVLLDAADNDATDA